VELEIENWKIVPIRVDLAGNTKSCNRKWHLICWRSEGETGRRLRIATEIPFLKFCSKIEKFISIRFLFAWNGKYWGRHYFIFRRTKRFCHSVTGVYWFWFRIAANDFRSWQFPGLWSPKFWMFKYRWFDTLLQKSASKLPRTEVEKILDVITLNLVNIFSVYPETLRYSILQKHFSLQSCPTLPIWRDPEVIPTGIRG